MKDQTSQRIEISANLLGNAEIRINSQLVGGLSTLKARALLIYLVMESDKVHPRGPLSAFFWPDVPEETALHNLRQALVLIKKSVEPIEMACELVLTTRESIRLNPEFNVVVDALIFSSELKGLFDRFKSLPERGFPIQKLERILSLRQGEFLPSITLADSDLFEDWLTINRESINHFALQGGSLLLHYYESRGEWVKASRCAEQLTKLAPWDELAHSRYINSLLCLSQSEAALAHFHNTVNYLRVDLGIEPGRQMQEALHSIEEFRQGKGYQSPKQDIFRGLPRFSTPFIGRKGEVERLEEWIADPQSSVITITGPGGSGKTRLAARVAESQITLFRDGVFFITIDGCLSVQQIATRVLNSIVNHSERGIDPFEELLEWVDSRKVLLVLDNVDSCSEAAEFSAKLIARTPSLLLMFTSYSRLDLMGEKVLALQGLSITTPNESVEYSEAIQLFLSHLQYENQPGLENPGFMKKVEEICELVEGLPLGIDLAAGQVKKMPADQFLIELKHNMDVLRSKAANLPERHRSIEASFENVWIHMDNTNKRALSLLTLFRTPFTAKAAESIFEIQYATIIGLVENSLLIWDGNERYRFHRAIKEYAHEKLVGERQDSSTHTIRYSDWFYKRLLTAYEDRQGDQFPLFLDQTQFEMDDYGQSIRLLIEDKQWEKVQRMIDALFVYFEGRSLFRQGSELFLELVSLCKEDLSALRCQVMLSSRAALLLLRLQQFDKAQRLLEFTLDTASLKKWTEELAFGNNILSAMSMVKKNSTTAEKQALTALGYARESNNEEEEAHALYNLSYARINKGDLSLAEESLTKCRVLCSQQKNWRRLSKVLSSLADIACFRGEFQLALDYYNEAVKIARSLGNKYSESLITNNIGTVYMELHEYSAAKDYLLRSAELCGEIDDREGVAIALSNLGEIAVDQQDFLSAIKYTEDSIAISTEIDSNWAEMSARIVLAEAWRKLGDLNKAKNEVITLLNLANETVSMNFFHRGVFEACSQLTQQNKLLGLHSILYWSIQSEGIEESTRIKSQALFDQVPSETVSPLKLEPPEILAFLCQQLMSA